MTKISLNAAEESIRALLVSFAKEFPSSEPLVLRFVGGWVRDKLLNRPSNDIDVAIDKTTGETFAKALYDYLAKDNSLSGATRVHTVASNPAKSKHLETATMRLFGLEIDFVNLRSEEYASDSRVPQVQFGTPEEDALRRDATVNALFYNLAENKIEDFTGRGLDDLEAGILRTPLDPHQTFKDDPLRILRLLRFSSQLGFELAPETSTAMQDPAVSSELETKVSRERIGIELQKLLEAPHALKGLRYIVQLGLANHIFTLPNNRWKGGPEAWESLGPRVEQTAKVLPQLPENLRPQTPEDVANLWLSVILSGAAGQMDAKSSLAKSVVMDGIKLPGKTATLVGKMVNTDLNLDSTEPRSELGMFVRTRGEQWPLYLTHIACITGDIDPVVKYSNAIITNNLDKAYDIKPILDGKLVSGMFPERKRGPWLAGVLDRALRYQLDHPTADLEELKAHVK